MDNSQLDFSKVVSFKFLTSKTYHALTEVKSNFIYFLVDTCEIYKGGLCFTNSIIKCSKLPADPSRGKVYYNTSTRQMMFYDSDIGEWVSLLTPIINDINTEDVDLNTVTVTAQGIKNYIDAKFEEMYKSLGKQPGYNTTPIFDSYEAAVKYALESPLSKAGQCITAPTSTGDEYVMYVIQRDGSLKEYPSMAQIEKLMEWKAE